ncbi:MAG: divalent metal cation transporter [Gammaproteobacteria bacterium]|nr:divalent metal cation transporter [Gammaproteobacteria bacterium]
MRSRLAQTIGPGVVLAGSAVGVSHLVQSTRAGAMYGMGLVGFILLANLAKYPAFLFAPRYAALTGRSILSDYRRQGAAALGFFGLTSLATMCIATAANLLVTAGLVQATLPVSVGLLPVAAVIAVTGMALLVMGHYHWLDRVIKALMVFLTLATLAATWMALPMVDWSVSGSWWPERFDRATVLFLAALAGWMPTPLDVSVWQSQWTVAKIRDTGVVPTARETAIDFNIGYAAIIVLALCFVVLGAAVMHGSGERFEDGSTAFATQVIALYERSLGPWSGTLVGFAALAVMFSTLLTILDGFPRGLANWLLMLHGEEEVADPAPAVERRRHRYYWGLMGIIVAGALLILSVFMDAFKTLVDIGATIAFLCAPGFAWLNHRAITGPAIPGQARPGPAMRLWSLTGIAALSGFALLYLYLVLRA